MQLDPQTFSNSVPKLRGELRAAVRGEVRWGPEVRHPRADESVRSCRRCEGNGLGPVGRPVNHSEKVGETVRGGEWTYEVDIDMVKPPLRNRKKLKRGSSMAVHFSPLTGHA